MSLIESAIPTVSPPTKRFRLAGVQIASLSEQQSVNGQTQGQFAGAIDNGFLDVRKLSGPSVPVTPVFEDEAGQRFLGVPTALGPRMVPFENARPFDIQGDSAAGGFLSSDDISSMKQRAAGRDPSALAAFASQAAQNVLAQKPGGDGASMIESFLSSTGLGIGQQALSQGLMSLANGGDIGSTVSSFVATAGTNDGLAQLGQSLASGLVSNALSMGIQAAMSGWQVDDESSTAEHAAHQATQALIGKLQSELMNVINDELAKQFGTLTEEQIKQAALVAGEPKSLSDRIQEFFAGPSSTANIPIGHLGCGNTNEGMVMTGGPTVKVNELQVSRLTDKVTMTKPIPDIGPLISGNPTVLSMGQPTAGDGHVAVGVKGTVTLLQGCSANVLMGPQGMPVAVPTATTSLESSPAALDKVAAAKPTDSAAGSKAPSASSNGTGSASDSDSALTSDSNSNSGSNSGTPSGSSSDLAPESSSSDEKGGYQKVTGDPKVDLRDQRNGFLDPTSPTSCKENSSDAYACGWWHCTNNCELTRSYGENVAQGGSYLMELGQVQKVKDGNMNYQTSAYQCSDWGDNAVGRAIGASPAYDAWTCEAACAYELGGYRSSDLPEVPGGNRPPGPMHPQGTVNGCSPQYQSFDYSPATQTLTPKPGAPPIPAPPPEFAMPTPPLQTVPPRSYNLPGEITPRNPNLPLGPGNQIMH